MKKIACILFCLFSISVYAQKLPEYNMNKVRITLPDKIIVAALDPTPANPKIKPVLSYYWYSAGDVHKTQGGFSGKLLSGQYTVYYLNNNLKEQGIFKGGLKDGIWKEWGEDGLLLKTTTWRKGVETNGVKAPIWKRIPLFRKKKMPVDSSKKIKK